MSLQSVVEVMLAVAALLLLARDLQRARRDRLRRPVTLLAAALVAALLAGMSGGRAYPSPWWLVLPATVLVWEVSRGWRLAPRCHLWEAGAASFALGLLLALAGHALHAAATWLFAASIVTGVLGVALLWRSHLREPRPWRVGDASHYERRSARRVAFEVKGTPDENIEGHSF
jgi:hypothetical protein